MMLLEYPPISNPGNKIKVKGRSLLSPLPGGALVVVRTGSRFHVIRRDVGMTSQIVEPRETWREECHWDETDSRGKWSPEVGRERGQVVDWCSQVKWNGEGNYFEIE